MAEEIRGLNVKFDADFSDFKKNMKAADKDISSTQRQLKTLQESLKLKWDAGKFAQAQTQAQNALKATEEKATLLRNRLQEIERAGVTDSNRDEYNYLMEQIDRTDLSAQKLREDLEKLDDIRVDHMTEGLDKATDKLEKAAQKTKALSVVAAGAVAGLTAIGMKSISTGDEIATLATQYNISTEAVQRFNYVALQTDISSEMLYKGLTKIRAGLADLSVGASTVTTKAIKELGLSFSQFDGEEDQFYAIVDALSSMEDQTKMLSIANDIFGEKMATNLLPLIYAGTDAVNGYREEFEELGYLTDEEVQAFAKMDEELNKLKTQYSNVTLQLGSGLLPVIKEFSDFLVKDLLPVLQDVVSWFGSLDENEQRLVITTILLTMVLSSLFDMLADISEVASAVVSWLGKVDKATALSTGKWLLLAASVGSLFSIISNWSNMNPVQKVVGLLGALSAAALAAAIAFGAFHSAWSVGLAVAGIVAGIAAATAAVKSAGEEIGAEVGFDISSYQASVTLPDYNIPNTYNGSGNVTNNESSYVDNSTTNITIEKNDYVSEEDIIRAVNRGLKEARQSRS